MHIGVGGATNEERKLRHVPRATNRTCTCRRRYATSRSASEILKLYIRTTVHIRQNLEQVSVSGGIVTLLRLKALIWVLKLRSIIPYAFY